MNNEAVKLIDEKATIEFAQNFAKNLQAGDVVAIYGNLGAGKTAFCRGIIQALCGQDTSVISPTFNLLQTYLAANFEIFHFDLYRLKHADEVFELGIEEAFQGNVCLIEWPEIIEEYLPKDTIKIYLSLAEGNSRLCRIHLKRKISNDPDQAQA